MRKDTAQPSPRGGAPEPPPLEPLWPEAPRLCPGRPFPAYRYVPRLHPHPTENPQGHSYGRAEDVNPLLPPEHWRDVEDYRFGLDLYHQGYLWESHEAWEGLWRQADRRDPQARFLQGLIQNSAAQLKAHLGAVTGTATLSRRACQHLEAVLASGRCDPRGIFMGLNVPRLLDDLRRHYGPVWNAEAGSVVLLNGRPPLLLPDKAE